MGERMKKFLMLLSILCFGAYADTINLHWLNDDGSIYENSTCTVDSDLELPTPPTKYGYTFTGWKLMPYIPLEYIQSTGTQWIDTGYIYISGNHKVEIGFSTVSQGNHSPYWVYGSTRGDYLRSGSIALQNNLTRLGIGAGDTALGSSVYTINNPTNKTILSIEIKNNNRFFVSGGSTDYNNVEFTGSSISNLSEYLFATNYNNTADFTSSYKMYLFKMWDNNILVRDFIPVLDYSGVPCMYDRVEGKFYYNQGTGQFIAGPILQ